eukprot:m.143011 g.143011  ORF g.143011 m.143011 type:complete len:304 (-) comp22957_c0_seq1:197-1108(-)
MAFLIRPKAPETEQSDKMGDAVEEPVLMISPPGQAIDNFKKCQYLGHIEDKLVKNTSTDPAVKMREIHFIANKAMSQVHKDHKHRALGFSSCYVTSEGIYLYEAEQKVNVKPTCSWSRSAREIYCVVMGARSALFKNQLACIMRFVAGPNGKVQLAKDGSIAVDCCVIEFHHDRKNRAAKFHKACEQMMKALLFAEMSKIDEIDAAAKEETKGDEGGEIVGGYMDVPIAAPSEEFGDEPPAGYMDVPEPNMAIGKAARRRISLSVEEGGDYLQVVVASMGATSLGDALAGIDDDDDEDPADAE